MTCHTPTPEEIRSARLEAGLTQSQAADLVCSKLRTWQQWEAGDRGMHPGLWALFDLLKNADQKADQTTQNSPIIQPTNGNGINISC